METILRLQLSIYFLTVLNMLLLRYYSFDQARRNKPDFLHSKNTLGMYAR